MREWGVVLFFVSFFLLYLAGSLYIAMRTITGLKLTAPYSTVLYTAMTVMALVSTIGYVFSTYNTGFLMSFICPLGTIWQGLVGISFTLLFFNDIINLGNLIFKIKDFRYYSTIITLCLILLLFIWALANTAFILRVKEVNFKVPNLKTDKLNIVMLADMHITSFTKPGTINKIVEKVNSLDPDIIVLAGDMIDTDISESYASYGLDKLKSKYGTFAIIGNHEYYAGMDDYIKFCKKAGINLLINENYKIDGVLTVAGINDKKVFGREIETEDIEKVFEGIDKGEPILFLSHRPDIFEQASGLGFNIIQLSGHTHAGQLVPVELIKRFSKYRYGIYQNESSYMYVTSGVRWWGPPMRLLSFSEIANIVLEK